MKIIDQTPLIDEKGQLSLINRLKGMLTYGYSWPARLQAQQVIVDYLNRVLERGYVLIRNQELGKSKIVVPLLLIGSAGIYVIYPLHEKGFYRAQEKEWYFLGRADFEVAPINVLTIASRLAQAVQVFLERQGVKLAAPVEAVVMATDPGIYIESIRPVVRVVMFDAIERFAAGLLTARPLYTAIQVNDLVDHIEHPRPLRPARAPSAEETPPPAPTEEEETATAYPFQPATASRLQTILHAPQSDQLIETAQERWEEEEPGGADWLSKEPAPKSALKDTSAPTVFVRNPPPPETASAPARPAPRRRLFGLTVPQLIVLAVLGLVELCVVIGGVILILNQFQP